ncbi:MAG: 30S ribosomal protein S12 methylthiotransferase RimO [Lachnospiraceae bacterium]|jgi:ribosomal protein S12 methylthiotransferase|nr:30S ribosomal protein S12 methylthiotransferase RimO [Lachnospiraceae bacterium]
MEAHVKKVAFVSLGCDKNTVDSEIMLTLLTEHGYEITKQDEEAEAIVINTCAFIQDAQEESINAIIEMGQYKEVGRCRALIVTGCLAQRYADEMFAELPEVDAVVGTGSYEKIVEVMDALLLEGKKQVRQTDQMEHRDLSYHKRTVSTPGYYEYLKIAEGCDNHCTYCIIPKLRGRYRSRRKEDILQETRDLAAEGVKELMIVAQDITKYGRDLPDGCQLPELLHEICQIDGIEWIRLLYCYPEDITDELIHVMQTEEKILPYIDMPIQHCSNTVLRRMGRRHTKEELQEVMAKLRKAMPEIAIRTTLITGFPGETEEEFQEMMAFVEENAFERLGVFTYSQEEGTPAALLPDQIPEQEKARRQAELMALQKEISEEASAKLVGRELMAIIEGRIPEESEEGQEVYSARTYRDAPEIDGFIFITAAEELRSGDIVRCRVTGAYEYDLIGELI